jgi:hypothetical protein
MIENRRLKLSAVRVTRLHPNRIAQSNLRAYSNKRASAPDAGTVLAAKAVDAGKLQSDFPISEYQPGDA